MLDWAKLAIGLLIPMQGQADTLRWRRTTSQHHSAGSVLLAAAQAFYFNGAFK